MWHIPAAISSLLLRVLGAGAVVTFASAHDRHAGGSSSPWLMTTPRTAELVDNRRQSARLRCPRRRCHVERGTLVRNAATRALPGSLGSRVDFAVTTS
ncbi:hypothetical protein PF005_g13224 [Phytophthora fragariae]|uniref:RxLR effector protein n=1 Tax=Phytophthora fragariae TaxID=53985 RepID=A0A6A3RRQ7_9STRA|nr:hypothetical protein PF003_g6362 [Phytophthora fragariae]KAE8928811.1 hypothetical protein PF009_g21066 [Phytophthora fragariae]KAE9098598.1 hypothetical protein PF010_g15501 [Phytophthora fragariae]KAE9099080.1 hypothetical protein PF007_g16026 [Phytophthora fragariae]KAE9132554.1 hypothetical protein PF006_g15266 [Phytophthora fragariae]